MNREILVGDVLEKIKEIPDETIDCEITSPPYWGLRDYGIEGQWGLEEDVFDYLAKLQKLMDELKRILKPTGSCWINLGDTYAGGRGHWDFEGDPDHWTFYSKDSIKARQFRVQRKDQMQDKTQMCIPERFKIAAVDSGWIARNTIPWIKPNAMPSSVEDRFSNKWEPVYFFVKSKKYYFNLKAVKEPILTQKHPKLKDKSGQTKLLEGDDSSKRKQDNVPMADGKPDPTKKGFNERWENKTQDQLKNPGDVFIINTQPFPEAHFATFPEELPMLIIKCACPPAGMVFDPFFGAGTVGVAAEKLDRRWCGIEIHPEYVKLARKRLEIYRNTRLVC